MTIERAAEVRAAVVEAMQTSWDEFVGDTGCYPDCFRREGKLLYADFRMGNFATWVADRLLAAEGLLVTDEQQRLIRLGEALERLAVSPLPYLDRLTISRALFMCREVAGVEADRNEPT